MQKSLLIKNYDPPFEFYLKRGLTKNKIKDFIFLFIFFVLPSRFLGIIDQKYFYVPGLLDISLIAWLGALPLYLLSFKRGLRTFLKEIEGKMLVLIIIYIVGIFIFTVVNGTSARETFTVFRKGYFTPISGLALLLYLQRIDIKRFYWVFKWIFVFTILQGILYSFQNLTGIMIFPHDIEYFRYETIGNISINRTLSGFPIYSNVVFLFSLIQFISNRKVIYLYASIICASVAILSATRSVILSIIFMSFMSCFFYAKELNKINIDRILVVFVIFIISFFLLSFISPNHFHFIYAKFLNTFQNELQERSGTYFFRYNLILDAYEYNKNTGNLLFGSGYVRFASPGYYDLALGGDTHTAAVLFAEGIVGLIIRLLPVFYFLFLGLKKIYFSKDIFYVYYVFIVTIILFSFLNILQTPIFRNFNSIMILFYAIIIFERKYYEYFQGVRHKTLEYNGSGII